MSLSERRDPVRFGPLAVATTLVLVLPGGETSFQGEPLRTQEGAPPSSGLRALGSGGHDSDNDILPDAVELAFGFPPFLSDSDGDGSRDGVEWMFYSDPLDPLSVPVIQPGLRSYAYEADGKLLIFVAVFPSNLGLVNEFRFFVASPELQGAPLGDEVLGMVDFTPFLLSTMKHYSSYSQFGLQAVGVTFELDVSVVDSLSPLSFGIAADIANLKVLDQVTAVVSNGSRMLMIQTAPVEGTNPPLSFAAIPLDPGGGGYDDPEYCLSILSDPESTGAGGLVYQVLSADCVPDGVLFCVSEDCASLVGDTITTIDYGFLQDSLGE